VRRSCLRTARVILPVIGLVVSPGAGTALANGEPRLLATIDRAAITVGDPIRLTLRLIYPPGTVVESFTPERSLGGLTLLAQSGQPPEKREDGEVEEVRILRLTAYTLGGAEIPPFEAICVGPQGGRATVRSDAIPLTVASVLAADDTEPADIKAPVIMPVAYLWRFIAAALAAALMAAFWWWRRRPRRREEATVAAAPPRPPEEVAYAELERLLAAGLLEAGRVKEFYVELAEIVRRYLAARFGIDSFERTTSELLEGLRAVRLGAGHLAATAEILTACDLVKFARLRPAAEESRVTVERVYRFVDETRPAASAPVGRMVPSDSAVRAVGGAR